jgi:hypothetical protein
MVDYEALIGLSLLWVSHNNLYGRQRLKHRQSLQHLIGYDVQDLPPYQGSRPPRYQIVVTTQGPTTIDGPQTRDRIYDRTKPDSTIRCVNAQIVKVKRMVTYYDW